MDKDPQVEPDRVAAEDTHGDPSPAPVAPPTDDDPTVVYRRADITETESERAASEGGPGNFWTRDLAPAVTPVVIGFTLLLILISVLGLLSVRRMDEVRIKVLSLQQEHANRLNLLLQLRLALTRLNNEARARAESESRDELRPPFDMRLTTARDEFSRLLPQFDGLRTDHSWEPFRKDLANYLAVTEDLRRYSLEGFSAFKSVDSQLNTLLQQATRQHAQVSTEAESYQQEAARSIRLWTIIALIAGGLVAAGTIWEIQRRFKELQRTTHEARREREFTSQLLEGLVSAVAAIDENDRIRSANAAFFKIFPGASIGASIYEKLGNESAMKMLEGAAATRVDHAEYRGRWEAPAGENPVVNQVFDIYSSPLAIDGSRGQIVTLVDVTEAAESERDLRRQESLAAVGQATAQVAHEIRNPLGSIRLGVAMLRDNVRDQEGLNTIDLVERGIKHLNKLVVDVAQFSRRKALESSDVDLHELINRSLELVADKIKEKDTVVEKDLLQRRVVGHWDPDQLRQVLVNVIGNAIDASERHAPIRISTEIVSIDLPKGVASRRARLIIADQGKGMDTATVERVFEPFFSTKKRGTGLGLAIVKQIVDQHGGTISVQSESDKGTKFTIDLPL
ncbi:MAG TPA: ATP-binding protein [Pyrinomonadaceae bacterium]|nr:ATP-binding protein [Pyrinomonadaceae bacterium]